MRTSVDMEEDDQIPDMDDEDRAEQNKAKERKFAELLDNGDKIEIAKFITINSFSINEDTEFLRIVVEKGNSDIVAMVIDEMEPKALEEFINKNVFSKNQDIEFLKVIIKTESSEFISLMCDKNPNIVKKDEYIEVLKECIMHEKYKIFQLLMKRNQLIYTDDKYIELLIEASKTGQSMILQQLIDKKPEIINNPKFIECIQYAADLGNDDCLRAIVLGKNKVELKPETILDIYERAIKKGHAQIVGLLIDELKCDIRGLYRKTRKINNKPITDAHLDDLYIDQLKEIAGRGYDKLLRILIDNYPSIVNHNRYTECMNEARKSNNDETVRILLVKNKNITEFPDIRDAFFEKGKYKSVDDKILYEYLDQAKPESEFSLGKINEQLDKEGMLLYKINELIKSLDIGINEARDIRDEIKAMGKYNTNLDYLNKKLKELQLIEKFISIEKSLKNGKTIAINNLLNGKFNDTKSEQGKFTPEEINTILNLRNSKGETLLMTAVKNRDATTVENILKRSAEPSKVKKALQLAIMELANIKAGIVLGEITKDTVISEKDQADVGETTVVDSTEKKEIVTDGFSEIANEGEIINIKNNIIKIIKLLKDKVEDKEIENTKKIVDEILSENDKGIVNLKEEIYKALDSQIKESNISVQTSKKLYEIYRNDDKYKKYIQNLKDGIQINNKHMVKLQLDETPDIAKFDDYIDVLKEAIEYDRYEIFQLLMERAPLIYRNQRYYELLIKAVESDQPIILKQLINKKPNITNDENFKKCLFEAIKEGHKDCLNVILTGENKINLTPESLRDLLKVAIKSGQKNSLRMLIDTYPNSGIVNTEGYIECISEAINNAQQSKDYEIAKILIAKKAMFNGHIHNEIKLEEFKQITPEELKFIIFTIFNEKGEKVDSLKNEKIQNKFKGLISYLEDIGNDQINPEKIYQQAEQEGVLLDKIKKIIKDFGEGRKEVRDIENIIKTCNPYNIGLNNLQKMVEEFKYIDIFLNIEQSLTNNNGQLNAILNQYKNHIAYRRHVDGVNKINAGELKVILNLRNSKDDNILMTAIKNKNFRCVELLIKYNFDDKGINQSLFDKDQIIKAFKGAVKIAIVDVLRSQPESSTIDRMFNCFVESKRETNVDQPKKLTDEEREKLLKIIEILGEKVDIKDLKEVRKMVEDKLKDKQSEFKLQVLKVLDEGILHEGILHDGIKGKVSQKDFSM